MTYMVPNQPGINENDEKNSQSPARRKDYTAPRFRLLFCKLLVNKLLQSFQPNFAVIVNVPLLSGVSR